MDNYKDLRAALAAGPTPGQWRAEMVYDAGYAHINFDSREWNTLRGFCGEANAKYIAAANPEAIRALLAERDALRKALEDLVQGYVNTLECGRDRIVELGGQCDPVDAMEAADPYLRAVRAALAQEQGGAK